MALSVKQREQTEKALRESEAKYRNLFEHAKDAIILVDTATGLIFDINTAGCELVGLPKEKILGMPHSVVYPPELIEQYQQLFKDQAEKGTAIDDYMVIQRSDGTRVQGNISTSVIQLGDKKIIQGVFRDVTESLRMAKALKESEEKISKAFRAIPEAVSIATLTDGVFLEVNDSFLTLNGYSREEVIGHNAKELNIWVNPNDRYRMKHLMEKKGRFENEEFILRRKSGEERIVLLSADTITYEGKSCILTIGNDITERKKMEESLVESTNRQRILIEQSSDGIVILDQDGAVYNANQRFADMLGYSLEEVRQLKIFDWSFRSPREKVLNMLRTVDEKGDRFETQHRRKDGSIYDVEISTNGVMFSGQKLVFCICRDITERKQMEEALRESEEKFSKAFNATPQQIIITRASDEVTLDVNNSFIQNTGFTREETIGKTSQELGVWRESKDMQRLQQTLKEHGRIENEEYEFITKSGEKVIDLLTIEPVTIGGEKCWLSVSTDITRQKQIEKELRDSEESISKAFQAIPEAIAIVTVDNETFIEVNDSFPFLTGYSREELMGHGANEFNLWVDPSDHDRIKQSLLEKGRFENEEFVLQRKSGETRTLLMAGDVINFGGQPCILVIANDITERKRTETLQKAENRVLTLLSQGAELNEILDAIILLCEQNDPSITGSYLLYDASKNWLSGFGPSLSQEYNAYMKTGIPIGPDTGSPVTANFLKQRVIVKNIKTSPVLKLYKEAVDLTNMNGFRAVWAEPVISSNGDLLGTIANYSARTGEPTADNIKVLEWAAKIAAIAIERKRMEKELKESEEKFSTAFHAMPESVSISRMDDSTFVDVNASFCRETGHTREEIIGQKGGWVDPKQRKKIVELVKKQGRVESMECEFRKKSGELHTLLISADKINIGGEPCLISIGSDITERKRMEKALRESEEKFSTAFRAMPEAVSIVRMKDGVFIDVNDSFCSSNGYTREEVIGHNESELITWVDPGQREKLVKLMFQQGHIKNLESEIQKKSGEIRTILMSADVININGEPCVLNINSDITERKKMEQALKESEEKFFKVFRGSPELIAVSRKDDNTYIDVNDSFIKTTGYTREELIGHSVYEINMFANPEDQQEVAQFIKENGNLKSKEYSFRMKSGEIRQWLCSTDMVNIGGIPCSIASATDITEHKLIEQALKESEEKFSKAFHAMPETISITSIKDGRFMDVNESFLKLNQLTREEVIGYTAQEIQLLKPRDKRNKIRDLLKKTQRFKNVEIEFKAKSGKMLTFLFSADTIEVSGETCLMIIGNDITKRKLAENDLQRALIDLEQSSAMLRATNKELESFSYSVSHDLRSPLRSIDGFSQALLEDYSSNLDEKGQDYLNRLRNASQKMGELIDGLLKLSRLTRSEMHYEKVDLSSLANEIASRLQETHTKRQVEFVVDSNLTTTGDPQMLRVLLENLLGNAWKFTRNTKQARIEFGSTDDGATKTFFIKDNGAGFDMAFKDKLFGAFQRLHDATEFPGTGIGLATVQRIINRHGGIIHAEGATGKGATFYFTLN